MLVILIVLLACFALQEAVIIAGGRSELKSKPEAVLILGCKLWGDAPSPALKSRLDTALDYLTELEDEGCFPVIAVSGGQGSDEPMSEAACMAEYLAAHGIAPERILLEDASTNTAENLLYARDVLKQAGWGGQSVTVVSNDFHLTRVRMLAGRILPGTTVSTLSAPMPDLRSALYSNLREAFALVKSFLMDP